MEAMVGDKNQDNVTDSMFTNTQVFTRTLATAAGQPAVPVTLHGIDGRYATALFSAAAKRNQLDAIESDLKKIKAAVDKDASLATFLETPILDRAAKKYGVAKLLSQSKYNELTTNFFDLLAENGRLDQTHKIINSFGTLMTAYRGEVTVTVTSAKELDAKISRQLQSILQKSALIEKDQKLVINSKVDSNILGGLVIEVGEKTIDLSVSSRVAKLDRLLKETI
ncbi:ATP synthase F0 subcomplex subunit OSCP atp5 [Chytridiales sp. JEL 0842]|nr:ATP synthase F0 subcomplex subunit OSCP atp5 [Chytridiales sp. JEL 0842]